MLCRLLHLRNRDKGRTRGAVLTGQPGIGGSHDHIITRCDGSLAHLFSRKNHVPEVHA